VDGLLRLIAAVEDESLPGFMTHLTSDEDDDDDGDEDGKEVDVEGEIVAEKDADRGRARFGLRW